MLRVLLILVGWAVLTPALVHPDDVVPEEFVTSELNGAQCQGSSAAACKGLDHCRWISAKQGCGNRATSDATGGTPTSPPTPPPKDPAPTPPPTEPNDLTKAEDDEKKAEEDEKKAEEDEKKAEDEVCNSCAIQSTKDGCEGNLCPKLKCEWDAEANEGQGACSKPESAESPRPERASTDVEGVTAEANLPGKDIDSARATDDGRGDLKAAEGGGGFRATGGTDTGRGEAENDDQPHKTRRRRDTGKPVANPAVQPSEVVPNFESGVDEVSGRSGMTKVFHFSYEIYTASVASNSGYSMHRKEVWVDGTVRMVPDQMSVIGPVTKCESGAQSTTTVVTTQQEFSEMEGESSSLAVSGSVEAKGVEVGGSYSSSDATQTQQRQASMKKGRDIQIFSSVTADTYRAELLHPEQALSAEFKRRVQDLLNYRPSELLTKNRKKLNDFIEDFGSHYVKRAKLGGSMMQEMSIASTEATSMDESSLAAEAEQTWGASVGGSAGGFGGSVGVESSNKQQASTGGGASSGDMNKFETSTVTFVGGMPNSDYLTWCHSVATAPAITGSDTILLSELFDHVSKDLRVKELKDVFSGFVSARSKQWSACMDYSNPAIPINSKEFLGETGQCVPNPKKEEWYCPRGLTLKDGECTVCKAGEYVSKTTKECIGCEVGTYTVGCLSNDINGCLQKLQTKCTKCPSGRTTIDVGSAKCDYFEGKFHFNTVAGVVLDRTWYRNDNTRVGATKVGTCALEHKPVGNDVGYTDGKLGSSSAFFNCANTDATVYVKPRKSRPEFYEIADSEVATVYLKWEPENNWGATSYYGFWGSKNDGPGYVLTEEGAWDRLDHTDKVNAGQAIDPAKLAKVETRGAVKKLSFSYHRSSGQHGDKANNMNDVIIPIPTAIGSGTGHNYACRNPDYGNNCPFLAWYDKDVPKSHRYNHAPGQVELVLASA